MPETNHPLQAADREAMTAMRAMLATRSGPMTREAFDRINELVPAADGVSYRAEVVGGVPGTWAIPRAPRPRTSMLYLHGGVFLFGSAHAFRHLAGQIAARAGVATFVADYRLAPEHAFPAALDDARAAHRALAASSRVALVGDSAGGGLALTLLAAEAAFAGVLLSPWTDLALTGDSLVARAGEDPLLSRAALAHGAGAYLRGHAPRDAAASSLHAELARVPPTQVHVGTAEILLDDARRLAHAPNLDVHVWDGMPHVFPRNLSTLAAGRDALDQIGRFVAGLAERA
jgi:acetyl esterase/lipase